MAINCCRLTSQLDCAPYCLTSISNTITPEMSSFCGPDEPLLGPTIGNLSISGYALDDIYTGCPGKASVSIPWIRKYDCDLDVVHFLFKQGGQASVIGKEDIEQYVVLHNERISSTVINASIGGSPVNMYTYDIEHIGFGLTYVAGPIQFSTETGEAGVVLEDVSFCGINTDRVYLTSFNVNFVPGEIPIASYNFVYAIEPEGG